ncbi:MAG: porin family protein [Chlorobi bacterium]|nr:porin family protein [Chlorobiota bacterium]
MKNLKLLTGLLIIISFATSTMALAQDSIKIVIISKKIGAIIDAKEKEEYRILPKFKDNFVNAIFYMDSNNQFYCKVRLKAGESFKDSILSYNYNSIRNIAAKAQMKENGRNFNINDVQLYFADGKKVQSFNERTYKQFTRKIPLAKTGSEYSQLIRENYGVGLASGIIINPYSYKDLSKIFYNIARNIVLEPEKVSESDFVINSFPLFSFSSVFFIQNSFSLELEYSFGGNEKAFSDVSYKSFSVSIAYLYSLSQRVFPYLSIGYSGFNFKASQYYSLTVKKDSVGTLETISLEGKGGGLKLSIGMIYKLSDFLSFNLFGGYRFTSPIKFDENYNSYIGYDVAYKMKGFEIGLKILFR